MTEYSCLSLNLLYKYIDFLSDLIELSGKFCSFNILKTNWTIINYMIKLTTLCISLFGAHVCECWRMDIYSCFACYEVIAEVIH